MIDNEELGRQLEAIHAKLDAHVENETAWQAKTELLIAQHLEKHRTIEGNAGKYALGALGAVLAALVTAFWAWLRGHLIIGIR